MNTVLQKESVAIFLEGEIAPGPNAVAPGRLRGAPDLLADIERAAKCVCQNLLPDYRLSRDFESRRGTGRQRPPDVQKNRQLA